MNAVISPGDRVKVAKSSKTARSIIVDIYHATVIEWMPSGRLRVKPDTGNKRVVSADNVKKLADAPNVKQSIP